jgi:hypothetical protein
MKTELELLKEIKEVEIPVNLLKKITSKIEESNAKKASQFRYLAAASVLAIIFNICFVFQYYNSSDFSSNEANLYNYASSYQTIYE